MTRLGLAAAAAVLLAVSAACGGDDGGGSALARTPTPGTSPTAATSPAASASPAGSAAAAPPTAAAATSPTPAPDPSLPGYPSEKRAGIKIVDLGIDAILSGDPEQLVDFLSYGAFLCSATSPAGQQLPPCPDGTADGTRVLYFQAAQCGYAYVPPTQVGPFVQAATRPGQRLYAIWSRDTRAGTEYTLLFAGPPAAPGGQPTTTAATVDAGGVKALTFACGGTPQQFIDVQKPAAYLLPPPA